MRIALAIGDAGGVGPELAAKLLASADMQDQDFIVVGDARVLDMGARHAGVTLDLPRLSAADLAKPLPAGKVLVDLGNCPVDAITLGSSSPEAGGASLQNFAAVLRLAKAGLADAVMFTPFNKHSMRLSRPAYVDEIGFIDAVLDATGKLEAIQATGYALAYKHSWDNKWRSSFIYSALDIDNDAELTGLAVTDSTSSYAVNLIYQAASKLMFGVEVRHAPREVLSGAEGDLNRVQFSAKYDF